MDDNDKNNDNIDDDKNSNYLYFLCYYLFIRDIEITNSCS